MDSFKYAQSNTSSKYQRFSVVRFLMRVVYAQSSSQTYITAYVSRDSTCIHGGPFKGATVGPHAINQGQSWDIELVAKMSTATANEMRANSQRSWLSNKGEIGSLSCDGGPLANNAHDPRWGRISETCVLIAVPFLLCCLHVYLKLSLAFGGYPNLWLAMCSL